MPLINRFRIVNFRYDDDKKYISNELYEFDGKNALINLENGGGKSVILQLALQAVLPNTSMGSRNFSDYFKVGSSPTHIMVEWKLDGTRADYLLTGICVSKNADGLRFFTYTHTYTLPHDLDIKGMDAVNRDKQIIGFSEYHNYLKRLASEMRLSINVYSRDRQREYRDKLYTFNLFREEFDAIKTINQSEGGIDKFFENARKSRNVIEKLIIPNIPQAEGENSGILAQTFKKHLENLKNIPLYQHNIKMYEAFCERAANLLSKLEEYGATVEDINSASRDILALSNLIGIASDKLHNEVESLKDNDRQYSVKIEELLYKKESLDYQKRVLELMSLKRKHEDILSKIIKVSSEIEDKDKRIRFMESAFLYEDVLNARRELSVLRAQLDTLSTERDEIDREYQNCIYHAKFLLDDEIKEIRKVVEGLKKQLDSSLKEKEELKKSLDQKDNERDNIRDSLSSIHTRLKDTKDRQSQITGYFVKDMTLLVDPKGGLQNLLKERDLLLNKRAALLEEVEKANKTIEDFLINETRLKEAAAASFQKQKNAKEDIEAFETRLNRISREISMYEIDGDVYSKEAAESLKALKIRADNSLSDVLGRYHELLKRKYLFDGCEYYIPDIELKKVYGFLKDSGVRCIPGSLWIKNQREDLREELLHRNPLLCHSIVIERPEIERVNSLSGEILKMVENYPVAIIVDSEEGIAARRDNHDKASNGIDRLGPMEAYIVFSKNSAFSLNPELFRNYLQSMDQSIAKTKSEYDVMKKDVEKITGLIERCREFVELYPESYLREAQSRLDAIFADIKASEDSLKEIQTKRESLLGRIRENQSIIRDTDEQISEKDKDIESLKMYIELTGRITELEKQHRNEDLRRVRIEEEKSSIIEDINSVSKNIEDIKNNMDVYTRHTLQKKKISDEITLKLSIQKPTMKITGTLEEILWRAQGLERKIADSEGEQIRKLIDNYRKNEDNGLKQIRLKGFYEFDFEGQLTEFTEEGLEEERKTLSSLKSESKTLNEKKDQLLGEVKTLEGRTDQLRLEIEKRFKTAPYEFESLESIDISSFNAQIDAYLKKRQKNAKKLEDTEKRRSTLVEYGSRLEDYINEKGISILSSSRENMDSLMYEGETISIWDILKLPVEKVSVIANTNRKRYLDLTRSLGEIEIKVKESYDELYRESDWAENVTIRMILEKIIKNDMYNYKYVKELFKDIIDSVENMKRAAQFQLDESIRDKEEIVQRCYSKAESIYEEVKSVDTFSKIKLEGTNRKTIVIEMPTLHPEEGKALMTRYLEVSISEIEKMKAEGRYDPARIDGEIAKIMSPVRLLDAVTNLNEYSIKVFKPESTMGASRYIPWEVVINWSGGEKLAGFFAMFISIISYLRYKKTGWQGSSKVIWIDNPFGQANASYLLSYIFDLARATNTQMICLTGHMQVDIYMQFDVVYSLIHRMLTGMNMSVIQSKLVKSQGGLESASYKIKQEQMTLF
ncbi:MAG: chromosome partitioning protein ParA [Bacillota bacterium]